MATTLSTLKEEYLSLLDPAVPERKEIVSRLRIDNRYRPTPTLYNAHMIFMSDPVWVDRICTMTENARTHIKMPGSDAWETLTRGKQADIVLWFEREYGMTLTPYVVRSALRIIAEVNVVASVHDQGKEDRSRHFWKLHPWWEPMFAWVNKQLVPFGIKQCIQESVGVTHPSNATMLGVGRMLRVMGCYKARTKFGRLKYEHVWSPKRIPVGTRGGITPKMAKDARMRQYNLREQQSLRDWEDKQDPDIFGEREKENV